MGPIGDLSHPTVMKTSDRRSVGGRSSRATSSSDNSEITVSNNTSNHSALHGLVSAWETGNDQTEDRV